MAFELSQTLQPGLIFSCFLRNSWPMIYAKTSEGLAARQAHSPQMSSRQRAAFIMFDGKRDSTDVLKATAGIGITDADIEHLVSLGFLESNAVISTSLQVQQAVTQQAPLGPVEGGPPLELSQANYSTAYPIATRLTAGLGLRGFRLNLAVEAAGDLEKLKELAPRIKDAVGAEKFKELEDALYSY
jgi:hypothetical protein